ncbi:hypothetical protein HDU86_001359 [Geranomyces michiganensis]|nr:hypothetical protein HDU86_001359 [Geranomyces michiganensis]
MAFSFLHSSERAYADQTLGQGKTPVLEVRGHRFKCANSVAKTPALPDPPINEKPDDSNSSTPPSWPDTPPGANGTYHDVRDLGRCLWEKAKFDAQAKDSHHERIDADLWDDSVTLLSRWHLAEHPAPQAPPGRQRGLDQAVFDTPMEGLRPEMSLEAEKERLKREEAGLLVRRWQELWEAVRPPAPYWYELRTPDFTYEARRAMELDSSPARQRMEAHVRNQVMDLHRTVAMDRRLTAPQRPTRVDMYQNVLY